MLLFSLYGPTKNSPVECEDGIKEISSGSTKQNYFLMIFVGISLKFKKSWPNFFKFQSIFILAIGSNKQQETVSMPKSRGGGGYCHIWAI